MTGHKASFTLRPHAAPYGSTPKFRLGVDGLVMVMLPQIGRDGTAGIHRQRSRHRFLSAVGTNRWQCGHLPPKYPKNRKRHRIWATSFSNLVGTSPPPDFKSGGYEYPPSSPVATPLSTGPPRSALHPASGRGEGQTGWSVHRCYTALVGAGMCKRDDFIATSPSPRAGV